MARVEPTGDDRPEDMLTLREAAARARVDYATVRRWISSERLDAYRWGPKLIRVKASDLDALMRPIAEQPRPEKSPRSKRTT